MPPSNYTQVLPSYPLQELSDAQQECVIYGGTFDPPHQGHIDMVKMVLDLGVREVRVVPTADPIHKQGHSVTPFIHRHKMARIAFKDLSNVLVDDIESRLPQPTPTIETLNALFPDLLKRKERVPFLLGGDSIEHMASWVEAKKLVENVLFLVAPRKGSIIPQTILVNGETIPLAIKVLDRPMDISATELRKALRSKEALKHMLTQEVLDYIQRHNLYQD